MTIYSAILCAALLWLGIWAIWPGPKRDNCTGCIWRGQTGAAYCLILAARGVNDIQTQLDIKAGRLICPVRQAERRRRWWDRG